MHGLFFSSTRFPLQVSHTTLSPFPVHTPLSVGTQPFFPPFLVNYYYYFYNGFVEIFTYYIIHPLKMYNAILEHDHCPLKIPCMLAVTSHSSLFLVPLLPILPSSYSLETSNPHPVSIGFSVLDISYTWNCTECGL